MSLVRTEPDERGINSHPALCVWLDASLEDKAALIHHLGKFGPAGHAAAAILHGRDPRIFHSGIPRDPFESMDRDAWSKKVIERMERRAKPPVPLKTKGAQKIRTWMMRMKTYELNTIAPFTLGERFCESFKDEIEESFQELVDIGYLTRREIESDTGGVDGPTPRRTPRTYPRPRRRPLPDGSVDEFFALAKTLKEAGPGEIILRIIKEENDERHGGPGP